MNTAIAENDHENIVTVCWEGDLPYPHWKERIVYPELENTGPAHFDVSTLDPWLHLCHENEKMTNETIHEYLKYNGMLIDCLGLWDLLGIQKKGPDFYRAHFKGMAIPGWKSVIIDRNGDLNIPFLLEDEVTKELVIRWHWLGECCSINSPVYRFKR